MNANRVERASRSFKQARRLLYIIGALCCSSASAQTVIELFNPAAREYIHGNNSVASNLVSQALVKYPTDEKLKKLKELIEQQQQQQEQQQQEQQQQDQQQNPEEQDPQEAQPSQAQPHQAGEMSEEEAQQLLDAMKQNEKDQRTDLRPILGQPVRVDKDW